MRRFLFVLFLILVLAYFGGAWFFSNLILNPPQGNPLERTERMLAIDGPNAKPVKDWLSIPDTFSIVGAKDANIKGWHFKVDSSSCGIVMAHGWSGSRMGMINYMDLFKDCGCDIVAYDHRGHNQSGKAYATGGILEAQDLLSVTEWFKKKTGFSNQQIGWVGVSWGGATVLQAGATDEDVAFILSDSPFQNWYSAVMERAIRDYGAWINAFVPAIKGIVKIRAGVDFDDANALQGAPDIEEPVFLIHSKTDEATASAQSVNIAAALDKDKMVFHHTSWGNGHADDIKKNPAEFKMLVDDFRSRFIPNFGNCK